MGVLRFRSFREVLFWLTKENMFSKVLLEMGFQKIP